MYVTLEPSFSIGYSLPFRLQLILGKYQSLGYSSSPAPYSSATFSLKQGQMHRVK